MKTHTTNYFDTFIEVAEDTKAISGTKPSSKSDRKTVAEMQYEIIGGNPYKYTSDDVLFQVFTPKASLVLEHLPWQSHMVLVFIPTKREKLLCMQWKQRSMKIS